MQKLKLGEGTPSPRVPEPQDLCEYQFSVVTINVMNTVSVPGWGVITVFWKGKLLARGHTASSAWWSWGRSWHMDCGVVALRMHLPGPAGLCTLP
jgi:hypothetical protein